MGVLEIIVGVLVLLLSVAIIGTVVLQQGHREGLGAITGGADSFLSKNKARTADAMLPRWTKIMAVVFFVLAIVANVIALNK